MKKNQPISDGDVAVTLPVGFRPSVNLRFPCLAATDRVSGFLIVNPQGGIGISFGDPPTHFDVLANFSFLADG